MADEQFRVEWIDAKREPTVDPNPEYPNGIDVVIGDAAKKSCRVELPYPAKRCGYYRVECRVCDLRVAVSTAGRPDDPTSATFNCKVTVPTPVPVKKPKPHA